MLVFGSTTVFQFDFVLGAWIVAGTSLANRTSFAAETITGIAGGNPTLRVLLYGGSAGTATELFIPSESISIAGPVRIMHWRRHRKCHKYRINITVSMISRVPVSGPTCKASPLCCRTWPDKKECMLSIMFQSKGAYMPLLM